MDRIPLFHVFRVCLLTLLSIFFPSAVCFRKAIPYMGRLIPSKHGRETDGTTKNPHTNIGLGREDKALSVRSLRAAKLHAQRLHIILPTIPPLHANIPHPYTFRLPISYPASQIASVTYFIIPDLISHCHFKLRVNRHEKQVTSETMQWLFHGGNLVGKSQDSYHGLKAGLLTAMTYPHADFHQLRVCNDFLTYLFFFDNLSDDMDNRETAHVANNVLNSLYHPHDYISPARVGRMAAE